MKQKKFPGLPDPGLPCSAVPKPTCEGLTQATITLRKDENVRVDRSMKGGMLKQVLCKEVCLLYLNVLWKWILCLAREHLPYLALKTPKPVDEVLMEATGRNIDELPGKVWMRTGVLNRLCVNRLHLCHLVVPGGCPHLAGGCFPYLLPQNRRLVSLPLE